VPTAERLRGFHAGPRTALLEALGTTRSTTEARSARSSGRTGRATFISGRSTARGNECLRLPYSPYAALLPAKCIFCCASACPMRSVAGEARLIVSPIRLSFARSKPLTDRLFSRLER